MNYDILEGDALSILPSLTENSFDAVITDPPYSSGGATLSAKIQATSKKYTNTKSACPFPDFEGDAKDQRSWTRWCAEWLMLARMASKPGAPVCVFCDWRQQPSLSDALQWAGWIWRGTAVWDKVNSRPQKGRFRQQAEFILWGSNGDMPVTRDAPVIKGVLSKITPQKRQHQTQKPLELMQEIVRICEPGGKILDPFAGSGTTVLAAMLEGYDAVGIELSNYYATLARERIEKHLEEESF